MQHAGTEQLIPTAPAAAVADGELGCCCCEVMLACMGHPNVIQFRHIMFCCCDCCPMHQLHTTVAAPAHTWSFGGRMRLIMLVPFPRAASRALINCIP